MESDRLCVQVNAYVDNKIDVGSLLEDSDTKNAALEQVADLEEALSHVRVSLTVLVKLNFVYLQMNGGE